MARLSRPADPQWWGDYIGPSERLYHGTSWPRAQQILREGLVPWNHQESDYHPSNYGNEFEADWLEPRPDHAYMAQNVSGARNHAKQAKDPETGDPEHGAILAIDPTYLDPKLINPDEDAHPRPHQEDWDEEESGIDPYQWNSRGEMAHSLGWGDEPSETRDAIEKHGLIAYNGTIPPEAITLHQFQPNWYSTSPLPELDQKGLPIMSAPEVNPSQGYWDTQGAEQLPGEPAKVASWVDPLDELASFVQSQGQAPPASAPSVHHNNEFDFVSEPVVSPLQTASPYPPGHEPQGVKTGPEGLSAAPTQRPSLLAKVKGWLKRSEVPQTPRHSLKWRGPGYPGKGLYYNDTGQVVTWPVTGEDRAPHHLEVHQEVRPDLRLNEQQFLEAGHVPFNIDPSGAIDNSWNEEGTIHPNALNAITEADSRLRPGEANNEGGFGHARNILDQLEGFSSAYEPQRHVRILRPSEGTNWAHDKDDEFGDAENIDEEWHELDPYDEWESIPDQASRVLWDNGVTEPSSSPQFHSGLWYSHPDQSSTSAHLEGFTPDEEREVWAALQAKQQHVPDSPPEGHPDPLWDNEPGSLTFPEGWAKRGASEDELHYALEIPQQIKDKIKRWVDEQKWPEDTEFEDPEDYHITLLYSKDGHDEHRDADWLYPTDGYDVKVVALDEFGDEAKKAVVLRIESGDALEHANDLLDAAENRGLDISRFPGGYKPHLTVAYAFHKPAYARCPKLRFKTGPSQISPPREAASTQDPYICRSCLQPTLSEPKPLSGDWHWLQTCTNCGRSTMISPTHPVVQAIKKMEPEYPSLLNEVGQPRALGEWMASSMDPKCPECGTWMQWRDAAGLTGLHPEGAWECTNQRCWNMIPPGGLAPDALPEDDLDAQWNMPTTEHPLGPHTGAQGASCPHCGSSAVSLYDANPANPSYVCEDCDWVGAPSELGLDARAVPAAPIDHNQNPIEALRSDLRALPETEHPLGPYTGAVQTWQKGNWGHGMLDSRDDVHVWNSEPERDDQIAGLLDENPQARFMVNPAGGFLLQGGRGGREGVMDYIAEAHPDLWPMPQLRVSPGKELQDMDDDEPIL